MASTSSLGASTSASTSEAQAFYQTFNEKVQDVRNRIESAGSEAQLDETVALIGALRAGLTEVTALLPAYDQQMHEQSLRQVNDLLKSKRSQIMPKGKFAFRRKPKKEGAAQSVKAAIVDGAPRGEDRQDKATGVPCSTTKSVYQHIQARRNETIVLPPSREEGESGDLHLADLDNCTVDVRSAQGGRHWLALQIRNVKRCLILAGNVDGSVMIHDASDCTFVLACRQFRMHSSRTSIVLLATKSIATIEHCAQIHFGPARGSVLDGSPSDAEHVVQVQDFDHISSQARSPNWSMLEEGRVDDLHRQFTYNNPIPNNL